LLSAGLGVASLTLSGCPILGNLVPPPEPCVESQVHDLYGRCVDECPPGTAVLRPSGRAGDDYCEPVPDVEVDSGVPDGSVDGSFDAGEPGGPFDAGEPDGSFDAGEPDAMPDGSVDDGDVDAG
jgi:hypothetical protein